MAPLMVLFLLSLIGLTSLGRATLIPPPAFAEHEWDTAIFNYDMNVTTAPDPVDNAKFRKLGLSLFYPVGKRDCNVRCNVPYMPATVAKTTASQFFPGQSNRGAFFKDLELEACCASTLTHRPNYIALLILEPAVATSRHLYGALAQRIASGGFPVLTVDHPYDSSHIQYQDGTAAMNNIKLDPFAPINPWNDTVNSAFTTRVSDLEFLVDELTKPEIIKKLFHGPDV